MRQIFKLQQIGLCKLPDTVFSRRPMDQMRRPLEY